MLSEAWTRTGEDGTCMLIWVAEGTRGCTHTHTHTHTCTKHRRTHYSHRHMNTCTHTGMEHMRTQCSHGHMSTCTCTRTHTHRHGTYTHSKITRTHKHTHMHTYTQAWNMCTSNVHTDTNAHALIRIPAADEAPPAGKSAGTTGAAPPP